MASAKSISAEISTYCNVARTEELIKVTGENLEEKLKDLANIGYNGIARHTFKENNYASSQYFIFHNGRLLAIIKEENISSPNPSYSYLERPILETGVLEVFSGAEDRLNRIVPNIESRSPQPVKKQAEIAVGSTGATLIHEASPAPPQTEEVPQVGKEREKLPSREELLRKFKIQEPDEKFVEEVIESYREGRPVSKAKLEAALLTLKSEISRIVGPKKAEKVIENKIETLGLNRNSMTTRDLETLVDSIYNTTFKKLLGANRAERAKNNMKKKLKEITS